jgi:hypothetical protein
VQLRTPTPPKAVTEPSTPWTSRTPKTILETQSHSKYLQERIRNHKSSSPESIIQVVRYFEKGKSILLGRIALLEDRVKQVEQDNTTIGRRGRGKKSRVQKGGPSIVEDASQAIDQIDVDTQVVAESSRSGRRAKSERPGGRRCSKCGKAGHNARTCQAVVEVNREEYSD